MMEVSFTRLVWKDALLVRSLLYIAAIAILVANLSIAVSCHFNPIDSRDSVFYANTFWILIPCLVAFGTPAMLIGTEQESGTLAWLRTLPIPLRNVIYSKLLVAFFSLALTWTLSSIVRFGFNFNLLRLGVERQSIEIASLAIGSMYFSVAMLLAGFVTSYLFRSPIASLVAVLPAMFSVYVCGAVVVGFFENIIIAYSIRDQHIWIVILVAAGVLIGVLILFVVLHHVLALRRLRPAFKAKREDSPQFSLLNMVHFSTAREDSVYRLNLQLRLPRLRLDRVVPKQNFLTRPDPLRALLWQAASQQAVPVITILILAIMSWMSVNFIANRGGHVIGVNELFFVVNFFGMSVLGSLGFYSDTLQRRHLFLLERGLSRSLVWFTRMTIPATVFLIITILYWQVELRCSPTDPVLRFIPVLAFTVGALTSLAATRPVFGLIASPVMLVAVVTLMFTFLERYFAIGYAFAISLAALPPLFATWRLLPRWLMGQRGIGFDARVAGYLLLGVLLVYVSVFGHRILTTPAALPEWRTELLSRNNNESEVSTWSTDDYTQAKKDANDAFKMGDRDLKMNIDLKLLDAIRLAREAIVKGELDSSFLFSSVETDERQVLNGLSWLLARPLDYKYSTPIIQALASESLRRQSRQVALVSEWKKYQEQTWRDDRVPGSPNAPKTFFGKLIALPNINYSFEQLRADRFVDAATKATLEYLDRDPSKVSSSEIERLRWLWANVDINRRQPPFSLSSDLLVADFRARMEATNQASKNVQSAATDAVDLPLSSGGDEPAEPVASESSR